MRPWFIASFFDIGHPCYGQLTPVKTRYLLTSIVGSSLDFFEIRHFFNPLTPVPAVTGRAKTHPQFAVPAVTGRKKACEDKCLSYPPWRHFGSPIVLLLLRTNKPMKMDFLSIFLADFRGPRKTGFCLKITKSAGNHGALRTNLQTSRVLFSFLKQRNYSFGT